MRRNQIVALGLAALGLAAVAGCQQSEPPAAPPPEPSAPIAETAPVTATYVCDSGLTVAVAYPDPQSAQVTYRDRTYALRGAPAASGARYSDAEVEWRSLTRDGVEQATLSRLVAEDAPIVLERCSRPAPGASLVVPPPADAAAGDQAPAAAAPPCRGPQLKLSAEGGDAGAGNRVSILGVQNIGAAACSLTGYPIVTLQDAQGGPIGAVRAEQSLGSYFRQGEIPGPVELAPQAKAFFDIAWNVVPDESQGQKTCPSAARIRITAPGDTSPVALAQAFTPCGGRIRVSPFRPLAEAEPAA
ncbi:MAG: DUF4232 domain-containing protein [Alphaproteobacteria bacterium]|nr:DUF4232 domain-containing protein [Alphaproteobacteria bacterium]MBU2271922.1 DUF4232 domain-containing protein [Alphaproteobacteria bacterium]MBU2419350.1 DUF4232 domain-containing protein [Alphaproteobacteria bacterium]